MPYPAAQPAPPGRPGLRSRAQRSSQSLALRREVAGALVSVAGLRDRPVRDADGNEVGRVVDVVVHWETGYSPLTGLIVRVGARRTWVHAQDITSIEQQQVMLRSTRFDLRDVVRREGELQLLADVIDHQLVDVHGVRVVRASDLYLTSVYGVWRLVGVDVSLGSLLRRVLPGGWGRRPSPSRVLDWSSIQPFGVPGESVQLRRGHAELRRMRSADLADLLESLGRAERRELLEGLEPETAADALEEMNPRDLNDLLRDAPVQQAADLVAAMESDEAVEALREMPEEERSDLLDAMTADRGAELEALLEYDEETAGGFMTSHLVRLHADRTVADAIAAVRADAGKGETPAGIVIVDDDGALLDDISVVELLGVDPATPLGQIVGPPWPVTVAIGADLGDIVERMTDNRGSSVVVVDAENRPVGRILADDVVDALVRQDDRRWPWQRRAGSAS
jgi:CBS domain-containing protein/sporulation protein YlmC with PRC-barrel domain